MLQQHDWKWKENVPFGKFKLKAKKRSTLQCEESNYNLTLKILWTDNYTTMKEKSKYLDDLNS